MGLTKSSVGRKAAASSCVSRGAGECVVALAGNPNVGKSTLFNGLTGMHQHTGNWPGKTVTTAEGCCRTAAHRLRLVDLPGTYSLSAHSPEEEVARDFICGFCPDAVAVVCDATCLERNLNLVLQIMACAPRVLVCVNLLDEAKRKGIRIDLEQLSVLLGVPVVGISARKKGDRQRFLAALDALLAAEGNARFKAAAAAENGEEQQTVARVKRAEDICRQVVRQEKAEQKKRDRRLDALLTGRAVGYPVMLLGLAGIFWLTISGANILSDGLAFLLAWLGRGLSRLLLWLGAGPLLYAAVTDGIWQVLSWVVSVMLPPMAIFFPLFTLLEDVGYLPRVAYNLDRPFQRCKACGKQALTMCMGFGCNAAGVVGCRIIDSPRERLLAILTNSFVPCNGRFPGLIAILGIFFVGAGGVWGALCSAGLLTLLILVGVGMTFLVTRVLSATLLKGVPSSFTLELPPYRKPQIAKVIWRSVFDRTLFVLGRAAAVAAPAGLLIWILANVEAGGVTLLSHLAAALDPAGRLMGLDGVILLSFVLGFPANEIVLPLAVMCYLAEGTLSALPTLAEMGALFVENGWTAVTASCFLLFSLMHWPCSTTVLTVYKETKSAKWTLLATLLPTAVGMLLCILVAQTARIFGLG